MLESSAVVSGEPLLGLKFEPTTALASSALGFTLTLDTKSQRQTMHIRRQVVWGWVVGGVFGVVVCFSLGCLGLCGCGVVSFSLCVGAVLVGFLCAGVACCACFVNFCEGDVL